MTQTNAPRGDKRGGMENKMPLFFHFTQHFLVSHKLNLFCLYSLLKLIFFSLGMKSEEQKEEPDLRAVGAETLCQALRALSREDWYYIEAVWVVGSRGCVGNA